MNKEKGPVLVAGINGFVGHHLANELSNANYSVIGVGQDSSPNIAIAQYLDSYVMCDLTDPESIKKLSLNGIIAVINLAGLADVGKSFDQKELYLKLNSEVHTNLYDRFIQLGLSPRVLAISSGSIYDPNQVMPIDESGKLHSLNSTNPYTASKLIMERNLERYEDTDLECVIVRPFNHTGPGQRPGFIVPDLSAQITEAKQSNSAISVGNLNTKRDFTDVRDVAKAYVSLIDAPTLNHKLYNVCSGRSLSGSFILNILKSEFNAENLEVQVDKSKIRPNDVENIYGSYQRLHKDTGWAPATDIEKTIRDFAEQYKNESQASEQLVA